MRKANKEGIIKEEIFIYVDWLRNIRWLVFFMVVKYVIINGHCDVRNSTLNLPLFLFLRN